VSILALRLIALVILSLPTPAADQAPIPSDHRWVLALDAATLMKGELGKQVRAIADQPGPSAVLAAVQAATHCDLLKDIDRFILTGVDAREEEAVFLAQGRFDSARIEQAVSGATDHTSWAYGSFTIHRWIDDNKHVTQFGAVAKDRLVVIGRSEARVRGVLDVLDNKASGLGEPAWMKGAVEPGALLVLAAADGLDTWQGLQPSAEAFKRLRSLRFIASDRGDSIAMHAAGVAIDAKAGQQIGDLLRGLVALTQMGDTSKQPPIVAHLLATVQIKQEGTAIDVTAALPIADIADAIAQQLKAGKTPAAAP
jgi:hypothetical protein